jgi:FkbM family methyltransferase
VLEKMKSRIKRINSVYRVLFPIVQLLRWFTPTKVRYEFVRRRCFQKFQKNPVLEVSQSGIVSRFHAISGKNYWHLYLNRNEMDAYLGIALKSGDVVLDIGGSVGAYTVPIAKFVGASGSVHVFEPEPESLMALKRNVALNALTNCVIHEFAVGSNDGSVTFFIRPEKDTHSIFEKSLAVSPTGRLDQLEVPIRSVDSMVREGVIPLPNFVKVDVEGAELEVLSGMKETIKKVRGLYVECHDTLEADMGLGNPVDVVTTHLAAMGITNITKVDNNHVVALIS